MNTTGVFDITSSNFLFGNNVHHVIIIGLECVILWKLFKK